MAERGSWVGSRQVGLWMREVRKLNPSGHQTSLISTDYGNTSPKDAGRLFSRWSQENFFRYAMEHLGKDLPEEHKFQRLAPSRKRLLDTVKMIAYRAETAMTQVVREELAREDDARALLRDLYRSEADILPQLEQGILEVRVHAMANPRSNRAIQHLLTHLNDAAFAYPGTTLQLKFTSAAPPANPNLVPTQFPPDQEV